MNYNEFEIIKKYFTKPSSDKNILQGIGDDAAIINSNESIVITTDTLIEGVHFPKDTPAEIVGSRSLAINLSDIASMGAIPKWCTMSISFAEANEQWISNFSKGFFKLADQYKVSLIGGDTNKGDMSISINLIGQIDRKPLLRSGGNIGDDLYITGSIGDASAGLDIITKQASLDNEAYNFLVNRFYYPSPRIMECNEISLFANSAIDISDGLVSDLSHLCNASNCGAEINIDLLPLSEALSISYPSKDAINYALNGGDDYEICFSAPKSNRKILDKLSKRLKTPFTRIGKLKKGDQVKILYKNKPYIYSGNGYKHF